MSSAGQKGRPIYLTTYTAMGSGSKGNLRMLTEKPARGLSEDVNIDKRTPTPDCIITGDKKTGLMGNNLHHGRGFGRRGKRRGDQHTHINYASDYDVFYVPRTRCNIAGPNCSSTFYEHVQRQQERRHQARTRTRLRVDCHALLGFRPRIVDKYLLCLCTIKSEIPRRPSATPVQSYKLSTRYYAQQAVATSKRVY